MVYQLTTITIINKHASPASVTLPKYITHTSVQDTTVYEENAKEYFILIFFLFCLASKIYYLLIKCNKIICIFIYK